MNHHSADALFATWRRGRKVLLVLGAGASRSAGVPLMPDVYAALSERVRFVQHCTGASRTKLDPKPWQPGIRKAIDGDLSEAQAETLETLVAQLEGLRAGAGSRAVASMALGLLQNAHRHTGGNDALSRVLAAVWLGFAGDFLNNRLLGPGIPIPQLRQAEIHDLAAKWIRAGKAVVVSLNFDGLTYRALNELLEKRREDAAGVVISDPADLDRFYLGGEPLYHEAGITTKLYPVIKVWGDVFHAACANSRCPEFERPVPIYRIHPVRPRSGSTPAPPSPNTGTDEAEWLLCPNCRRPRQLQIHFTGYERKEQLAQDLIRVLYRYVSPEIGSIVCIGFSGLWDTSLVEYVAGMGRDLQHEPVTADDPGDRTQFPIIVVDPVEHSFLSGNLRDRGLEVISEATGANEFAADAARLSDPLGSTTGKVPERFTQKLFKHDSLWHSELLKRVEQGEGDPEILSMRPGTYRFIVNHTGEYLAQFGRLRQLGIKTRAHLCRIHSDPTVIGTEEKTHNRRDHSLGAAHLAIYWFRQLMKSVRHTPVGERFSGDHVEYLASLVFYSALHHDIGHVPFTHLAEEIFTEVRWTLKDWADQFHHDEPVLTDLADVFQSDFNNLTRYLGETFNQPKSEIVAHMEMCIQGRSGHPWIDAILNSPLDVDKIDYIYRDCLRLQQGLHLNQANLQASFHSVSTLFNGTFVLPSGQVALVGDAGEFAKNLLEERTWLYRNQYFSVGYRVLERLAGVVVLQWLMRATGKSIMAQRTPGPMIYNDGSAIKGRHARDLLWKRLVATNASEVGYIKPFLAPDDYGECELLIALVRELQHAKDVFGFPYHRRAQEWFRRAEEVFVACLNPEAGKEPLRRDLTAYLREVVRVTVSDRFYLKHADLDRARRIAREIETTHYFTAFFDFAITPRVLSYPSRRRLGQSAISECFAVSHRDPDRWAKSTDRWVALSESAFAERDKNRFVKVMALSPMDGDPFVKFFMDAFRARCTAENISIVDKDPEL